MGTTIEAFNYQLGIDTRQMEAGATLARSEWARLRSTLRELSTDGEQAAGRINNLTRALNAGAVDAETYTTAVARLQERLPEQVAAQQRLAESERQAAQIRRDLTTESQRYAAEMERVKALVRDQSLSFAEARQHLAAYRATLPSVVSAERERAAAAAEAQRVVDSLRTSEEKHAQAVQRLAALRDAGHLTPEQFNQASGASANQLPAAIAERARASAMEAEAARIRDQQTSAEQRYAQQAERVNELVRAGALDQATANAELARMQSVLPAAQEAARIREQHTSAEQQFAQQAARVNELVRVGALDQATANAELARLTSLLPANVAAERERAAALAQSQRAEAERASAMDRDAARIRDQHTSADVRYAREVARVNELVRAGVLDQSTANAEIARLRNLLPEVQAAERRREAELQRAAQLTEQYTDRTVKLQRELRELQALESKGLISPDVSRRAQQALQATPQGFGAAASLPFVGPPAASLESFAGMAPPMAAAAAALLGVSVATKATSAALELTTEKALAQAEAIHRTHLAAQTLGTSTAQLAAFQAAAGAVRVGPEQAEKAFGKFAVKVAEAAAGSGEAATLFRGLGLDARKLAQQDPAAALAAVADAAAATHDPLAQARLAVKLFGDEGLPLAGIFARGADAIRDGEEQARRAGMAVSEVDAAAIDRAYAATRNLRLEFDGLFTQIATVGAPVIETLAQKGGELLGLVRQIPFSFEPFVPLILGAAGGAAELVYQFAQLERMKIALLSGDFAGLQIIATQVATHKNFAAQLGEAHTNIRIESARQAAAMRASTEEARQQRAEMGGVLAINEQIAAIRASQGPQSGPGVAGKGSDAVEKVRDQIEAERAAAAAMVNTGDGEATRIAIMRLDELTMQARELEKLQQQITASENAAALAKTQRSAQEQAALASRTAGLQSWALANGRAIDAGTAKQLAEAEALGATKAELQELLALREQSIAAEQRGQAVEQMRSTERELQLARAAEAWLRISAAQGQAMDAEGAKHVAELQAMGATQEQLQRELQLRQQLAAIHAQQKSRDDASRAEEQRVKALTKEAETIRNQQSPVDGLAAEVAKLQEMYRLGLLTAQQFDQAKQSAAAKATKDIGSAEPPPALRFGSAESYKFQAQQQQDQRRAQLGQEMLSEAEKRAQQLAGHTAELQAQAALVEQMRLQGEPGSRTLTPLPSVRPVPELSPTATPRLQPVATPPAGNAAGSADVAKAIQTAAAEQKELMQQMIEAQLGTRDEVVKVVTNTADTVARLNELQTTEGV